MISGKKIICVIPARLSSTRFPRKMLATLANRPLLQWVWDAASRVLCFDDVVFAVDAPEIADVIKQFGGKFIMTSTACKSGTDRLIEVASSGAYSADIWVNWQGDEPFINELMINDLLQTCATDGASAWTLKKKITEIEQVTSSNVAKVVCDHQGNALFFSRSPIPFYRDCAHTSEGVYFKHVGLYAFTNDALQKISRMGVSALEEAEKLEQLRWLQHGLMVRVHETAFEVRGIDTLDDLVFAHSYIKNIQQQV
ncbi:MAG: 3-deoxy-manno-octulosonate cytidylyltransferase [candidate division TM6 bacterium GW2011_GWF2_38_10]|nr:MAG: 3-deoxy-manno-octulosonate cytidylyltransferase [candidate division TM6 bacterium GW2011_GWF2_38_10]